MSEVSIPVPEPIFTTNKFSSLREDNDGKQVGKFDKYSHGHFFHYVSIHNLQFNVYNLYSFRNSLIHILHHLLYGGYKENDFVKFEKGHAPLIIVKLQLIRKIQDKNNKKFTHNFIECQYFGEERFTNLIDIIVNNDFSDEFSKELRRYNIKLSKGLHYIDTEIREIRSSLSNSTKHNKNIKQKKEETLTTTQTEEDEEYVV